MSTIFLSHSSLDDEIAAEVRLWLEKQGHRSVFLDFDPAQGIPPGRSWERELYRQLRLCRAVVVLCSRHSRVSRWCFAEIAQARSLGKHLIPFKIDDAEVEPLLLELQVIDLAKGRDEAFGRLGWALAAAGVDATDPFAWDPSRSPYPGLLALQEADAAVFFGREEEIGSGLDTLNRAKWQGRGGLVVILGASGAGKSSLLRAGLLPRLRRDHEQWRIVGPFKPGEDPLRALAGAFAAAFRDLGVSREWRPIFEALSGAGAGAPTAASVLELADDLRLATARHEAHVLLVIDQLEELLGRSPEHPGSRLFALLCQALDQGVSRPFFVLGTMRSDFLGVFQQQGALRGLAFDTLHLGPLPERGLIEAIERPAALAGLELEPGLPQAILHDAEGADAMPLVAFALRELYIRYADGGKLTLDQYRSGLGGLHGAVAKVAEGVLREQGDLAPIEDDLRRAFLALVRLTEQGQVARRPAAWSELPASVRPLLARFVDARLLTARGEGEVETVEVAHEALFSAWRKLAEWLAEGREALQLREQVGRAALLWQEEGRIDELLWSHGRLQRALELDGQGRLGASEGERTFLLESRQHEQQALARQRRRQRFLMLGVVSVAVLMSVLAVLAWVSRRAERQERRQAELQTAKALANQAWTAGYRLDQALLLAVESTRRLEGFDQPSALYEGRTALLHLLELHPRLNGLLHGHVAFISAAAWSPDGSLFASASYDGQLLLWRRGERHFWRRLEHCTTPLPSVLAPEAPAVPPCGERIKTVAWSPDGAWLASGSEKGKILIWDVASPALAAVLQAEGKVLAAVAFSPDGRQLASGDYDGRVRLWPRLPETDSVDVGRHESWISGLAFRSAGQLVSAATDHTVRFWDLERGSGAELYRGSEPVRSLAVATDGAVAAGFGDGVVRLWEGAALRTAQAATHTLDAHQGAVEDLAFAPDGRALASAGLDGEVRLWDRAGGRCLAELGGHVGGATAVAFEPPPGDRLLTGQGDGLLSSWDLQPRAPRVVLTEHRSDLVGVAFGAGEVAATGSGNGTVLLHDLRNGDAVPSIARQDDEVWGLALSPDGRRLATGAGNRAVALWDLATAELLFESREQETWIWSVAFSPDGALLATADEEGLVVVRDTETWTRTLLLRTEGSVVSLAFGPRLEQPLLALGHKDGGVELRDPTTGERRARLSGHSGAVNDLAFSPDGSLLATAGQDGTARVWPVEGPGGEARHVLDARPAGVRSIAFSGDGALIATGYFDGSIRIWTTATGVLQVGLPGHRGSVLQLAFAGPDTLFSGASDRTLRRWDLSPVRSLEAALAAACGLAGRDVSADEWRKFFAHEPYRPSCPDSPR